MRADYKGVTQDEMNQLCTTLHGLLGNNKIPGTSFVVVSAEEHDQALDLALNLAQSRVLDDSVLVVGDDRTAKHRSFRLPADAHMNYDMINDIVEEAEPFERLTNEKLGVAPNPYGYFYNLGMDPEDAAEEYFGDGYAYLALQSGATTLVFDGFAQCMPWMEPHSFHRYLDPAIDSQEGFLATDHNVRLVIWVVPALLQGFRDVESIQASSSYLTDILRIADGELEHIPVSVPYPSYRLFEAGRVDSDLDGFSDMEYLTRGRYEQDQSEVASSYLENLRPHGGKDFLVAVISPDIEKALRFATALFEKNLAGVLVTGTQETHDSPVIQGIMLRISKLMASTGGVVPAAVTPGSEEDHIFDLTGPYTYFDWSEECAPERGTRRVVLVARSYDELDSSVVGDAPDDLKSVLAGMVEVSGSGVKLYRA